MTLATKKQLRAAEIVAGVLKANARARLVGERTSGIGTVIDDYPLGNGSTILLIVA